MKKIAKVLSAVNFQTVKALQLISHLRENGAVNHELSVDDALFGHLSSLVNETADGVAINYLCPKDSGNGFHVFETNSMSGENLGSLYMLYLGNPIPCYYLVYVEVAPSFKRKGLGSLMIRSFQNFLEEKGVVGILDNIIPPDDLAYSIYENNGWKPLKQTAAKCVNYMVYQPRAQKQVRDAVLKRLIYILEKKRAVIDMKSNELMVKQTLKEFSDLYHSLLVYYEDEAGNADNEMMRFMFTRFATKFVAFRRSIEKLLGYTGGESTEQITNAISQSIAGLKVKSYEPRAFFKSDPIFEGDENIYALLPEELLLDPISYIEKLPCYQRPSLLSWMSRNGKDPDTDLTIGDILDLGFDPTRLKEIFLNGRLYIFERIPKRLSSKLDERQAILKRVGRALENERVKNARISIRPVVIKIQTDIDLYLLREKVDGIHSDEVREKLDSDPFLQVLNKTLKIDCFIKAIIKETFFKIEEVLGVKPEIISEQLTFFIPWDFKNNTPKLLVDIDRVGIDEVWML
jgi:GNAT superfamily N-acetyltransferase